MNKSLIALMVFALSSQSLLAAPVWCRGKLEGAYVASDGWLVINGSWRNEWTGLCNMKTSVGGVDVAMCAIWAAYTAKAVESQQPVQLMYNAGPECAKLPTYANSPIPYYVLLQKAP